MQKAVNKNICGIYIHIWYTFIVYVKNCAFLRKISSALLYSEQALYNKWTNIITKEKCLIRSIFVFKCGALIFSILAVILAGSLIIRSTTYWGAQRYHLEQVIEETVNNLNSDYKTIETEHFTIKYLPKAENKARLMAFYAESNYERVTSIFKIKPPRKTMMVLEEYDQSRINQLMTGYNKQGVIYIYDDPRERCPLYITIPHELSHAVLGYKYAGGYLIPNWINEGLAVNIETSITGLNKSNSDIIYPLDGLDIGLKNTPDATYAQCSAIIAYIVETHGKEALFQLLSQLANERKPLDAALQDTLHIDTAELEKNSQQYFRDNKEIHGMLRAQF